MQTLIEGGKELAAPIKLFYKESGKNWKAASSSGGDAEFSCPVGGLGDLIESLVMQGQHRILIDFEDHLNNIDEDWLNQHLHV